MSILWIFDQQPSDKVFGQAAGVAEELLVEFVVDGGHVCQGLLLVFSEERGGAAQSVTEGEKQEAAVQRDGALARG